MKKFFNFIILPFLTLTGCKSKKHYEYNKEFYESFFPHYVDRCEKFIRNVEREKDCDIVFLGDSITEGYPLDKSFRDWKFADRGISGDYTDGVIDRLEFCVYDLNPKVVYLMIGTNNLSSCTSNYEFILKGIKEHCPNTKVMVMSILPRAGDEAMEMIRQNNIKIEKFAENYGYFYVNAFTSMTVNQENLMVNNALFQDGLHPNLDGYKVITDIVKPIFAEWLK